MANGRTEKYSHQQLASLRLASAVQPTIVITSNLGYYSGLQAHEVYLGLYSGTLKGAAIQKAP